MECPVCKGTGQVETSFKCATCYGKGIVANISITEIIKAVYEVNGSMSAIHLITDDNETIFDSIAILNLHEKVLEFWDHGTRPHPAVEISSIKAIKVDYNHSYRYLEIVV